MNNNKIKSFLDSDMENILYWLSIVVIIFTAIIYFTQILFVNLTGRYDLMECRLKAMTGISCPGCGGTRALISLAKGDILSSLYYNAFAMYGAVVYGMFFITQTLQRITRGRVKGIKFRMEYLWIAIAIFIIQYVLKLIIPNYAI